MQKLEHEKWMSTVLDFGEAMMRSGAEVSRIDDSIDRICASSAADAYSSWPSAQALC